MIAPASRKIGKYEIREKLGRGGMADVYLAYDTEFDRMVALKLIEHSNDADTRDSIAAEMRGAVLQERLAAVESHVVRVYDAGDLEGFFFVSMEYIDGQDLHELMRHGRLEVEFATDTAIAVAHTLENAHCLEATLEGKDFRGIVHGDIKPKNIRIDARGEVRVLDFGIAKALSLSRRLTRNEFGSVPYASPERLESGEVNAGSDLWSLAVMLYEMLTGMQPYQADTTERLEKMIRSGIAPPPAPDPCPDPLRRILVKALDPQPEVRYQTAGEFAEDLQSFRNGGTVRAVTEDLDETRRTFRRDLDETRRTTPLVDDATTRTVPVVDARTTPEPAPEKPAAPKQHGDLFYIGTRALACIFVILAVIAVWSAISDYRLYARGQEFQHDVVSEQIADPNQLWDRWSALSEGHSTSWLLRGPRQAVKAKFLATADKVIDAYRNETQVVRESDWLKAHTLLLHALSTDPDDAMVRGKVRLTEGHLARISGTAHRSAADYNDAVDKFNDAQKLMGKSPDPYLGLARVYIYGLKDVDRAAQALQQAADYGHPMGNREKTQLADGYRERADRTWIDTRNIYGLPQEKEQIERAAADYNRALDLYQQAIGYGDSAERVTEIEKSLESIRSRLDQISAGMNSSNGHPSVGGAIIDLFRALRGRKKGTGPGGQ